jgi:hypothetical protein
LPGGTTSSVLVGALRGCRLRPRVGRRRAPACPHAPARARDLFILAMQLEYPTADKTALKAITLKLASQLPDVLHGDDDHDQRTSADAAPRRARTDGNGEHSPIECDMTTPASVGCCGRHSDARRQSVWNVGMDAQSQSVQRMSCEPYSAYTDSRSSSLTSSSLWIRSTTTLATTSQPAPALRARPRPPARSYARHVRAVPARSTGRRPLPARAGRTAARSGRGGGQRPAVAGLPRRLPRRQHAPPDGRQPGLL